MREADGSRWADFEPGDRSEQTSLRLYEMPPETRLYRTDAYQVYDLLPSDRHQVGKGGAMNWNEGLHSWCRDKLSGSLALLLADWPSKPYASLC